MSYEKCISNRFIKITGVTIIAIICFYTLQYVSSAIHSGYQDSKEDCLPSIYGAGEIVYRLLVRPPWLTFGQ